MELRILAYELPILGKVAARVAHGVVVLTLYERHGLCRVLAVFLAILHGVIHRAEDVGVVWALPDAALELHWARRVGLLYPVVCREEAVAVVGLVAKAPDDD